MDEEMIEQLLPNEAVKVRLVRDLETLGILQASGSTRKYNNRRRDD
jgi:hypothetical protein